MAAARECASRPATRRPWQVGFGDLYQPRALGANPLAALYRPTECAALIEEASWRVLASAIGRAASLLGDDAEILADLMRDMVPWPPPSQEPPVSPDVAILAQGATVQDAAGMAVLSDALEEARCIDDALLSHLRGPGPHSADCWALRRVRDASRAAGR